MTLTPEQKAAGWIEWKGARECPVKDACTIIDIMLRSGCVFDREQRSTWVWYHNGAEDDIIAYLIIEAHGADAEPARPTPFPADYSELVFDDAGWSQTIIVDGKRPEWLRDDDTICPTTNESSYTYSAEQMSGWWIAIRVRRREPKRETVECSVSLFFAHPADPSVDHPATIDLIDGKPDLSTLKIAEDAL